jgi:hypothetical protein
MASVLGGALIAQTFAKASKFRVGVVAMGMRSLKSDWPALSTGAGG